MMDSPALLLPRFKHPSYALNLTQMLHEDRLHSSNVMPIYRDLSPARRDARPGMDRWVFG